MSENEGLCFLPVSVLPVVNCSAEDVMAGDIFRVFYVFVFFACLFQVHSKVSFNSRQPTNIQS